MHVTVPLSQLTASRRNPRRVRPEREAHRRLVASIRAHGLLEPLIVQPVSGDGDNGGYRVIAGNRRLAALRDVYRGRGSSPDIPCQVRETDADTADALSLTENFARSGLHPLDEAEAFAKLASVDRKGVEVIAADFGVTKRYVRQRMKLATLAEPVKAAYREGGIDTVTAEAFAAVPEDRQLEVWQEVDGQPQHARHVQNIIANSWIDAEHALFSVDDLPDEAISRDLFSERVLIERKVFMDAQADALIAEREALIDDGWGEVVIAAREDVQDRLYSMDPAPTDPPEYDDETLQRLMDIEDQQRKAEAELDAMDEDDEQALEVVYQRLEALDAEEKRITADAKRSYGEATKAYGTAFLILDTEGRVRREYCLPRSHRSGTVNVNGHVRSEPGSNGDANGIPLPPTSDDLSDRQKATAYTHQALVVRETLLSDERKRRVVLALILHEKVRKDALAIRHETNTTSRHVDNTNPGNGFASAAHDALRQCRAEVDPVGDGFPSEEAEAYQCFMDLPDERIDRLIARLTVEFVTAHLHRETPLVQLLAHDLNVDIRQDWRPDAAWLNSFKKVQLAHLIGELRGPAHGSAAQKRKKSELVDELAALFTDAAEERLEDEQLARRANRWLPAGLRNEQPEATPQGSESGVEVAAIAA